MPDDDTGIMLWETTKELLEVMTPATKDALAAFIVVARWEGMNEQDMIQELEALTK